MLDMAPEDPSPLDLLLDQAGDATSPPPAPQGGIPKQIIPGWIRWPIRCLFLPLILLDLTAQKIARKLIAPPFKKEGQCLKRGNCCHYILIPTPSNLMAKINYLWSTEILGFYARSAQVYETEGKEVLVMGCRYLQKNGSCGHYHLRPSVCRKWPIIEHFGYPRLLKGCGFRVKKRS